jgi:thioredoxin-like negative regulator of GroEL
MTRHTLTSAARERLAAVVERYKADASAPLVATSLTESSGLELAAVSLCRDDLERARATFDSNRWSEAQRLYADIRAVAAQIAESGSNSHDARAVSTSALLGQVASLLNLQEVDRAREVLQVIDEKALDTKQRTVLARALVEIREAERARAVLDAVYSDERDNERWREASALVELARGNVPEILERVPSVLYSLANHYQVAGEVAKAAAVALEALAKDSRNPILTASIISTAMVALMRTIFEDDIKDDGIPVADRPEYARRIAAEFKAIFDAGLPTLARANLLEVALNYAGSLRERDLFRWIISHSDPVERDKGQPNEVRLAFEFAEKGDINKALEIMPRQAHPWRSDLMRGQLLRAAGDQEAALETLNGLVAAWPGRVPIHIALAEVLIDRLQFDLALPHAEAAYRGLSTPSLVMLLARCLIELNQGTRALLLLENLDTTEQILELRAYAADQAHDPRATIYWSQLLTYDADDTNARLHLAAALMRSGDIEGAARRARELLDTSVDTLGRDQIAACGQMLSMARFLPTSDQLIQRAAEALRTRFPADDKAEMLRLTLLSSLGFPTGAAPIDYERLARAGHVTAVSLDDAAEFLHKRTERVNAAHALYRAGCLDAETLCQVTGIKVATLVVGWSKAAASGRTPLRAAVIPGLSNVDEQVRGRYFLCSALELLLLQKCAALAHVPAALGEGFLVALDSTWAQLVDDAYYLERSVQRDELARLARLLAKTVATLELRRIDQAMPEREIARQDGLVFVTTEPTEETDVDARSLLRALTEAGAVSRPHLEQAMRYLGGDAQGASGPVELGARFLLENGLLELLDSAGILDALFAAIPNIIVTDVALGNIRQRLHELEAFGEAATLQRETIELLGAGLRTGWFRLEKAPTVSSLPSLREDVDPDQATLLTQSIRQQAAFKELLNQNKTWQRIAADSFGFDSFGHPQQWRLLAFKDEQQGRDFILKYWRPGKREITLSRFVRSLVQQQQRASTMRVLAQLGFVDALLPDDIISLVGEYGRVDVGAAARILDGMESSSGDFQTRGVFTRTQLAIVYAMSIWKLVKTRTLRTTQSATQQLLTRLEVLDKQHASRLVEQTLCNVVLAALDDREASFVEENPDSFSLVPASIAGQLWQDLAAWRGEDPQRVASFRRALAHAWEHLGELRDGPVTLAQWAPLSLANDILVNSNEFDAHIPSPDAVVAIMSALWKERPLARKTVTFTSSNEHVEVDIERVLSAAAAVAAKPDEQSWSCDDGTSMTFQYAPGRSAGTGRVSMPIEAVILRMEPQAAARTATKLAIGNGARDGRLYQALTEFAKNPTDKSRRKYLARAACCAPFKLVADDPHFIFFFGDRAAMSQQGYPETLEELRELLSEPADLTGADARTLAKHFFDRFEEGGPWFDREDKFQLVELASRVPGPLPAEAARSIFDQQSSEDLQQIERALGVSQNMPIGMLAIATAFAMLTVCNNKPLENVTSMTMALVGLLGRESSDTSEKDTLASIEPVALQSIGSVVSRFTSWRTSIAEHAWLTTRLYEWWMREADVANVRPFFEPDGSPWQRLRTEVVLNIMLDILEVTVVTQGRVPSLPLPVLEVLKAIACREGTNPFEAARRPAWIYWDRPQGCEWLASLILLWGAPDAFFDLRPELRLAMLEKLSRTNEQTKAHGISFQPVFRAISRHAERLTDPEVTAVHQWLNTAESGGLLDLWRAELLTGIFAARGDAEAAAKLRQLAVADTLRVARAELVGGYLEAACSTKVTGAEPTVIDLLDTVLGTEEGEAQIRAGVLLALGRPKRERVLELLGAVLQTKTLSPELRHILNTVMTNNSPIQGDS